MYVRIGWLDIFEDDKIGLCLLSRYSNYSGATANAAPPGQPEGLFIALCNASANRFVELCRIVRLDGTE